MEQAQRHHYFDRPWIQVRGTQSHRGEVTIRSEAKTVALKKSWLWLLIASIGLTLLIPLFLGGKGQFKLLHRLTREATALFLLLTLTSWTFNALRTRMLMRASGRAISFHNAVLVTMSAEFAGVTTPGAVGMPATYTFLFHNLGVRVAEAIGLVGLIVVTDLAFYGTLMPLAALFQVFAVGSKPYTLRLVTEVIVVVGGSALVLWGIVRHYRGVWHFIGRQMGKVAWLAKYRYRLGRSTVQFIRSLRLVEKKSWPWRLGLFLVTVGFWLPRYLIMALAIHLVGAVVPLSYLLLVQGVLNLGGQIVLLPGGAGAVGTGYAALLSPYLSSESLGFSLLTWRFFTFYWLLIVGGPIFLFKTGKAAHELLSKKT